MSVLFHYADICNGKIAANTDSLTSGLGRGEYLIVSGNGAVTDDPMTNSGVARNRSRRLAQGWLRCALGGIGGRRVAWSFYDLGWSSAQLGLACFGSVRGGVPVWA